MKMTKRYQPFNYGVTWLGIIRIAIGIYGCVWIYRVIFDTKDPLVLKIFLSILLVIAVFGCFVEGIPNIKKGIQDSKEHSQSFLLGRGEDNDE